MNELTKELLEALKLSEEFLCGPTAWTQEQENNLVEKVSYVIAKAEAALAAPQPSYDDWIPWAGGECPVGGEVIVAVKDRNGNVDNYSKAHLYDWHRTGSPLDIIAYRVAKP